jgi:hypothetical protein
MDESPIVEFVGDRTPRKRTIGQPVYNLKQLLGPITECIGKARPKRRKKKLPRNSTEIGALENGNNSQRQKPQGSNGQKKADRPRWWNQTYLLYLVLRKATRPLGRKDLISEALELDESISEERGLPKLFGGKVFVSCECLGYFDIFS